jgi:hypothetical protein
MATRNNTQLKGGRPRCGLSNHGACVRVGWRCRLRGTQMSASAASAGGGGGGGDGGEEGDYAEVDFGAEEGGEGEGGEDLEAELAALEAMTEEAAEENKEIQKTAESAVLSAADVLADKARKEEEAKERDTRSVFVSNVHWDATAAELVEYFSSCGKVLSTNILMDKHKQQPKGCVEARMCGGRHRCAVRTPLFLRPPRALLSPSPPHPPPAPPQVRLRRVRERLRR